MDLNTLRYSPENLWVRLDDDNQMTIGLTDEALEDYDEISKLRLPAEGDEFTKDEIFARLSMGSSGTIKIVAPISGEIIAINEDILENPEAILEDPYEEGWLVRLDPHSMAEYDDLMTREEYDDFIDDDQDDEHDPYDDDDSDYDYDDDEDEEDDDDYDDDDDY